MQIIKFYPSSKRHDPRLPVHLRVMDDFDLVEELRKYAATLRSKAESPPTEFNLFADAFALTVTYLCTLPDVSLVDLDTDFPEYYFDMSDGYDQITSYVANT